MAVRMPAPAFGLAVGILHPSEGPSAKHIWGKVCSTCGVRARFNLFQLVVAVLRLRVKIRRPDRKLEPASVQPSTKGVQ
jgi:hypothetical protein